MTKRKIEIDVGPVFDAASDLLARGKETATDLIGKGTEAVRDIRTLLADSIPEKKRDFTETPAAAPKWVSEANPYRKAMLDLLEELEVLEIATVERERDAVKGSPHAHHQSGRAHAFRETHNLILKHMPPEVVG